MSSEVILRDYEHAILGASGAHRWMSCTASVEHTAAAPDGSSEYADEGTAAHWLGASALEQGRMCADYIGTVLIIADKDGVERRRFTVDDQMATYVQVYVDAIRDKLHDGTTLLIEEDMDTGVASALWGRVGGTGDAVVLDATHGIIDVNDLKYGANPNNIVHAFQNVQLMQYGLGALRQFGWLADYQTVRLTIHQPRCDHISEWEVPAGELSMWGSGNLVQAIHEIDTQPVYRPDTKTCQWCPINASCSALADHSQRTVLDDFPNVGAATEDEVIAAAIERAELVDQWLSAVRQRARQLADAGRLPGWKVVQTRQGNRIWKDEKEAEKVMRTRYRMKKDEMYNSKLISPTDAEKKFAKSSPKRWEDLQEFIKRGAPATALVRADDPRPAVTTKQDFKVVK